MANEGNLKKLTTEKAREIGRKGGKRSGEVKRERRLLKEYMNLLLDLPVNNTKDFNKLSQMGIPVEEIDNRMMLVAALFKKAVQKGDVPAVKEIRNIIGEDNNEGNGMLLKLIEGLKNDG